MDAQDRGWGPTNKGSGVRLLGQAIKHDYLGLDNHHNLGDLSET